VYDAAMTMIAASTTEAPARDPKPAPAAGDYVPGLCNIGPAEIAQRRRAGHVGAVVTAGLFGILVVADAPPLTRLLVALPASVAAVSYLQAQLRFCAGFGSRGIYNFGAVGRTDRVADDADRARDRARATRIGLTGAAIGLAIGIAAALLPR
jgi:hypothetical protein